MRRPIPGSTLVLGHHRWAITLFGAPSHRHEPPSTIVSPLVPEGCEPADFFEEVAELARQVATDYDLEKLIE